MTSADPPPPAGWLETVRAVLDTLLGLARNRVELFAVELEEESLRALEVALRLAVWVVAMLLATITGTAAVALALWPTSPVLVLGLLTALYTGVAVWCWRDVRRRLATRPRPFAHTLAEFERDGQCLQPKDSKISPSEDNSSSPKPNSSVS